MGRVGKFAVGAIFGLLIVGGYATHNEVDATVRSNGSSVVANVTSGTIDGAVIGGTTPAAITGTTITATTKFVGPAGALATPSQLLGTDTNTGWYGQGANVWAFGAQGNGIIRMGNSFLALTPGALFGWESAFAGGFDLILARDAANTLALKNGNVAQEYRVYAGNGGFMSVPKTVTESLTIAAAATTVSATSIPAGAILLGVAVRVTTVIPTAATFTVTTTTGGTTLNTAAVSTAANSTDPGTAAGASYRAAATTVTITPNLTPAAATGVIRLQYYYIQVTPPTS